MFLVSSEFLNGAPFNMTMYSTIRGKYEVKEHPRLENTLQEYQKSGTSLVKLRNKACVEVYSALLISTKSDLILVSSHPNSTNSLVGFETGQESQLVDGSFPH